MLTDNIETKELFLKQVREIKDEVSVNFQSLHKDAWIKCLESNELTSTYYGFLKVLQDLAVEKFIKERYNGVSPIV